MSDEPYSSRLVAVGGNVSERFSRTKTSWTDQFVVKLSAKFAAKLTLLELFYTGFYKVFCLGK